MIFREFKHIQAGIRMEIVETWYFQIWVNFGGMAVSTADLKAVRGVYWSDLCNIQCYIPNENVGSLVFKSS